MLSSRQIFSVSRVQYFKYAIPELEAMNKKNKGYLATRARNLALQL